MERGGDRPSGKHTTENVSENGSTSAKTAGLEAIKMSAAEALEAALDQLGHFGLYQKFVLVLLCLPNLLAVMYSLNYVFVADEVPFRCIVPECEGASASASWQFLNESALALQPADASCRRYAPLYDTVTCDRELYHPNDTIPCEHIVYENYTSTFSEFDLGCREWMRTLVGTVRNAAIPFALILTGFVSDRYGRLTAFCIFSACAGALGIVKALSVNYYMYISMEFFEAALGYGFNSAGYVMIVELARPSQRASFACATGVAYGIGGVLFALVASRLRYWRYLLLAVHAPALLLPFYRLLLDDSVRWLHASGRLHRADAVIRKAARWNKMTIDENIMKRLAKATEEEKSESSENIWLNVIKSKKLLSRFGLCCWCWVAAAFVYYGLTINSVSLSGDKYVNFALNMAMEIVASLLIMMALERFGRKWSIFTAFLLSGISCVVPFFISHTGTGLGLFFAGKLSITFAFNSVYVYTAELFPTRVRSSALAACSLVGRIGSVLAPQTPLLSMSVQAALYGACSLSASLCVLMAPETRRVPLPHTLASGPAHTLASGPPRTLASGPPRFHTHTITSL